MLTYKILFAQMMNHSIRTMFGIVEGDRNPAENQNLRADSVNVILVLHRSYSFKLKRTQERDHKHIRVESINEDHIVSHHN